MYLVSSCYQVSTSRQKLMYNFRGNFAVICGHTQVYVPHDTFLTHTYSYFGISILSKSYHELHTSYTSKKYVSTCAHHLRKVSKKIPRNRSPLLGHNSLDRNIFVISSMYL